MDSTSSQSEHPSHPGVRFPPPLLFVGGIGGGLLLERYFNSSGLFQTLNEVTEIVGTAGLALGLACMVAGLFMFVKYHTAIYPNRPATNLVTSGPYRFSRNPMYLGLALAHVSGSVLLSTIWPVLLLPAVLLCLVSWVIRPEERYLTAKFGSQYERYLKSVRRFILKRLPGNWASHLSNRGNGYARWDTAVQHL